MLRTAHHFFITVLLTAVWHPIKLRWDKNVIQNAEDTVGDAKTEAKKGVRKVKRQVRKATGNESIVKDAKDKVNDAGDDLKNGIDKMKRK